MTIYDQRPWTARYPGEVPADLAAPEETALSTFRDAVLADRDAPCIHFRDRTLTFGDVDRDSDALAEALVTGGLEPGDRVALYLQNDPQFVVAQLATWKAGGVTVPVNPMLKEEELAYVLEDSGASVLVALDELHRAAGAPAAARTGVGRVITTGPEDWSGDDVAPVPGPPAGAESLVDLIRAHGGARPGARDPGPDDLAYLVYTSGTSGRPKGVMTSHANVVFNAEVYRRWMRVGPDDVILAGAPLFHITGLVAHVALGHRARCPIVLFHRFESGECLRWAQRWRATFTVMAVTAFHALMDHPGLADHDLSSLRKAYSGGAPVPPAAAERWEGVTGSPILNIYGLTETTSPSHATPLGVPGPVDPETGALSVGVPVPGARVRVVDPRTGIDVPVGEAGELWIAGPMVTRGYWRRPDATAEAFVHGYLRTGDVGKMDTDGWFFVVDRLKDMINASGYKVWPREVEDLLCRHPAVREAAVVGVPDEYRGETVKAFVVPRAGATVTPGELVVFARERLAAYKYPRIVEIVEELPKTASGKLLRRELRDRPPAPRA